MTKQEQIFAYKELRNNGQVFVVDNYEDADRIIEALEKQIPKKPKLVKFDLDNTTVAYCPNCDNDFGEIRPIECANVHTMKWYYKNGIKESYCEACGQSIDWKDTE